MGVWVFATTFDPKVPSEYALVASFSGKSMHHLEPGASRVNPSMKSAVSLSFEDVIVIDMFTAGPG